jgi:hypothetical protein
MNGIFMISQQALSLLCDDDRIGTKPWIKALESQSYNLSDEQKCSIVSAVFGKISAAVEHGGDTNSAASLKETALPTATFLLSTLGEPQQVALLRSVHRAFDTTEEFLESFELLEGSPQKALSEVLTRKAPSGSSQARIAQSPFTTMVAGSRSGNLQSPTRGIAFSFSKNPDFKRENQEIMKMCEEAADDATSLPHLKQICDRVSLLLQNESLDEYFHLPLATVLSALAGNKNSDAEILTKVFDMTCCIDARRNEEMLHPILSTFSNMARNDNSGMEQLAHVGNKLCEFLGVKDASMGVGMGFAGLIWNSKSSQKTIEQIGKPFYDIAKTSDISDENFMEYSVETMGRLVAVDPTMLDPALAYITEKSQSVASFATFATALRQPPIDPEKLASVVQALCTRITESENAIQEERIRRDVEGTESNVLLAKEDPALFKIIRTKYNDVYTLGEIIQSEHCGLDTLGEPLVHFRRLAVPDSSLVAMGMLGLWNVADNPHCDSRILTDIAEKYVELTQSDQLQQLPTAIGGLTSLAEHLNNTSETRRLIGQSLSNLANTADLSPEERKNILGIFQGISRDHQAVSLSTQEQRQLESAVENPQSPEADALLRTLAKRDWGNHPAPPKDLTPVLEEETYMKDNFSTQGDHAMPQR